MTIPIYLLGVCISAAVWFGIIKWRQTGRGIKMPDAFDGWYLCPLDKGKTVDWSMLMLGWVLIAVVWPIAWFILIGCYAIAWAIEIIRWVWNHTIGDEELARKIFGGKE